MSARPLLAALLLGDCAEAPLDGVPAELPAHQLAPPRPGLEASGVAPGRSMTLSVDNLFAGMNVDFLVGRAGTTPSGACHPVLSVCTDLAQPWFHLGRQVAGPNGVATFDRRVPAALTLGSDLTFQAIVSQAGTALATNTVTRTVGDFDLDGHLSNVDCDDTNPVMGAPGTYAPIQSVRIVPATARTDTDLRLALTTASTGPVTVSQIWRVNGVPVATGDVLPGTWFVRGDAVDAQVTVDDGCSAPATANTNAIVIGNTPPELSACTVSPLDPHIDDDMTATWTGAGDADGDTVTMAVQWQQRFGPIWADIPGATGPIFDSCSVRNNGSTFDCSRGSAIRATCTPFDGIDDGDTVTSDPVVVQNTAPVVTTCAIQQTAPSSADDLVAVFAGDDIDFDLLTFTFAWFINGTQAPPTPQILPASATQPGDVVVVSCTARDDAGASSATVSSPSVVVGP